MSPSGWRVVGRRIALTLGGEGIQSAFHFVLNIVLVRTLDAASYGLFAIVMMIGAVALTYVRALVGMPVTLHIAQRRGSRAARAVEAAFGSAALALAGVIALAVAALLELWIHAHAAPAALFVGLWSFRSYLRTMLLAEDLQIAAGASDLAFAATGGTLAAVLVRPGTPGLLDLAFLLLAIGHLVGIATAFALRAARLQITFRPSMRRRFRLLARQLAWSAAGTTTANAQAQGQVLLVAAIASPSAYAPIAAILVLFAPIRLIATALANVLQPELARRVAGGGLPGLGGMAAAWTLFAFGGCLLYGAVALAALPVMGNTVFAGQPKVAMACLAAAVSATFFASLLPRLLLEVFRQFHRGTMITAASAVLGMAAVVLLLLTTSPAWTLVGNLLAELLVLAWTWAAVTRIARARLGRAVPHAGPGAPLPVRGGRDPARTGGPPPARRPGAIPAGPDEAILSDSMLPDGNRGWSAMQRVLFEDRPNVNVLAVGARAAPAEPTRDVSDFRDLWRILWCRRRLILCVMAICALGALAYVVVAPPQYSATAQLLIDPRDRQIVSKDVTPDTLAADGGVLQVESQARVVASDEVLLRAVRDLHLAQDPDYGLPKPGLLGWIADVIGGGRTGDSPTDDEDRALRVLRRHITVKRDDKVFVVDVIFTAASADRASEIANGIAEAYLADQTEARARSASLASEDLTARLEELRASVEAAAAKVEAFKASHDLIGTDRQLLSDQQLSDNGTQLDAARARVAELQARADQIDALRKTGADGGAVPEAIQSSVVTQLRSAQAELVRKQSDMRTRFGDRYPDLIAINAQIAQGQRQIDAELARLARAAHADLERAKKNERALETSQAALKLKTTTSDEAQARLRDLEGERDARRALYQSFLSRAGETREQAKIDNTNARIISRAIPPIRASWLLNILLVLGGFAGGLGLGVALAFVAEYLFPTILSEADLQSATGAPAIGTVSRRSGTGRASRGSDAAGRGLRLGLSRICGPLNALRERPRPRTILVVGTADAASAALDMPEALARASMEAGVSTLFVEGAARETARAMPGLLNVLNGECSLKAALVEDEGRYRLPFGSAASPSVLHAVDQRFEPFLERSSRMFDLIVFDGLAASDDPATSSVASCVDDVLFVARRGGTRRKEAVEAAEAVAASTGRPVSAALLVDRWERG